MSVETFVNPEIKSQMGSKEVHDIYRINLNITDILEIDRVEGSLCIKEDEGKTIWLV